MRKQPGASPPPYRPDIARFNYFHANRMQVPATLSQSPSGNGLFTNTGLLLRFSLKLALSEAVGPNIINLN